MTFRLNFPQSTLTIIVCLVTLYCFHYVIKNLSHSNISSTKQQTSSLFYCQLTNGLVSVTYSVLKEDKTKDHQLMVFDTTNWRTTYRKRLIIGRIDQSTRPVELTSKIDRSLVNWTKNNYLLLTVFNFLQMTKEYFDLLNRWRYG